jgi:hypothetical protein
MFKPKGQPCGYKPHSRIVQKLPLRDYNLIVVIKIANAKLVSYQATLSNFRLLSQAEIKNFAAQKSPACLTAGGASALRADRRNIISSKNSQFVADNIAAGINNYRTFTIILPNLIHQSKKRNLRK